MRVWGMQLQWASSGRATALGVVYAIGLVGLLYWVDFLGFPVGLTVKVLLSVSVLWAYGTSIVGIRVSMGGARGCFTWWAWWCLILPRSYCYKRWAPARR